MSYKTNELRKDVKNTLGGGGGGGPENPDPPKISELDMYPPKTNNRVSPMKNENKVEVYKVRLFWAYFRPFLGQCLLISS